jgi:hypothetical protein
MFRIATSLTVKIGSPNQVEAVMSHFEKRPAAFSSTGLFRSGSR